LCGPAINLRAEHSQFSRQIDHPGLLPGLDGFLGAAAITPAVAPSPSLFKASDEIKPNIEARFRYAQYVEREIIDADKKQAIETIKKAADSGLDSACDHYGSILYKDHKDYEGADYYWNKALQNGETRAYYCLGLLHLNSEYSLADPEKAIDYYQRGVEEEDRWSYFGLGVCFFEGTGLEKNIEKSRELLNKSISLDHYPAKKYLKNNVDIGIEKIATYLQLNALKMLSEIEKTLPIKRKKLALMNPARADQE